MRAYRLLGAICFSAVALALAPARAEIDISSKISCPGVWVDMSSPSSETVKVCKRDVVVAAVPVERKRKVAGVRRRLSLRRAIVARLHAAFADRLAVAEAPVRSECTALMCPQFLLTGVGF